MTQPAFFLFSPSREDACRLGLEKWYDWFRSQGNVRLVDDTETVSGGIFISFSPVREERDAFTELEGKADRWLALDSVGNVSSSCLLAKKKGVDRLLHTQLIDEMSSPVIPSALLFLMDRGIWLPNTSVEAGDQQISYPEGDLGRSDKLLLFLYDEEFLEKRHLRPLLKMMEGDLNPFGYRAKAISIGEYGIEEQAELPSHLVLLSDRLANVLEVSRWAKIQSIRFAIWENFDTSPLRYVFAGGAYPESIGVSDLKLRPFFKELGSFLESVTDNDLNVAESTPHWTPPQSTGTFEFAWSGTKKMPSPFQPPIFASFLASIRGRQFVDWCKSRIGKRISFRYTPLYYSSEFFREHNPFDILFDRTLKADCQTSIARLKELLEEGYKVSNGYGAMHVLHLGWCSILLEECEGVFDHIAFAREPSFSALSEYACELGLALWYEGETGVAKKCFETVASIKSERKEWPTSFLIASDLFNCNDIKNTNIDRAILRKESDSWIDSMYIALSLKSDEDAWSSALRIDPERTEALRERIRFKGMAE